MLLTLLLHLLIHWVYDMQWLQSQPYGPATLCNLVVHQHQVPQSRPLKSRIYRIGTTISAFDRVSGLHQLHQKYVSWQTNLNLTQELKNLNKVFEKILSKTTDKGLQKSVIAEHQRQLNSFKKLEKKLKMTGFIEYLWADIKCLKTSLKQLLAFVPILLVKLLARRLMSVVAQLWNN